MLVARQWRDVAHDSPCAVARPVASGDRGLASVPMASGSPALLASCRARYEGQRGAARGGEAQRNATIALQSCVATRCCGVRA